MSSYSGPQTKGAASARRQTKRAEALARETRYDDRVLRYAIEHGVTESVARQSLRLGGYLEHQFGSAA